MSERLPHPIALNVPASAATPETGFLRLGAYQRGGHELSVNSRWLSRDGTPWMPVMGEFHYSRFPEAEWPRELRKMAAGGVNIVASYVFWNHHEEVRGQWTWNGQRDLQRFVDCVAEAGLLFYLRPGPWVHAEARLGGLPDWLVAQGPVRNNDPAYLSDVRRFFGQIGEQLRGHMWCDGGPVIGVQLENEYDQLGPGRGKDHIEALRGIALESGLTVPIYTVTGWPTLDIPERDVIPVSGAYADGFWSGSSDALPPSGVFLFDTSRAIGEMGNVGGTPAEGRIDKSHYPFFLAEAGGGMHVSYHRRPAVSTDDVMATALVQVGSGANLYGYYMYHGGANPPAVVPGATLQETQDNGYPNDVPLIGYDFRAPLGQYGQVRESFGRLRTLHQFMTAFGDEVAAMDAVLPAERASGPDDRTRLRVALRGAGDTGFLFVNNHVRHHPMPVFDGVQFSVQHEGGLTMLPSAPVTVPVGASFIWPLGLRLGAARLAFATVQPLTRWRDGARDVHVLFTVPTIPAELVFDAASVRAVDAPGATVSRSDGAWRIDAPPEASPRCFTVTDIDGAAHTVVLLSRDDADRCLHARLLGRDRLLIGRHPLWLDGDTVVTQVPDGGATDVRVYPADDLAGGDSGDFLTVAVQEPARTMPAVDVSVLHTNPTPPTPVAGPVVAWRARSVPRAPVDTTYDHATRFRLTVPPDVPADGRVMLDIDYIGDAARLYADGRLVDDHFFDGHPWAVGIDRFATDGRWPQLELAVLAADPDAPIFLEPAARDRLRREPHGLAGLRLSTTRELRLPLRPSRP